MKETKVICGETHNYTIDAIDKLQVQINELQKEGWEVQSVLAPESQTIVAILTRDSSKEQESTRSTILDERSVNIRIRGKLLKYWRENAEEGFSSTPISVLKYIDILEELVVITTTPSNAK